MIKHTSREIQVRGHVHVQNVCHPASIIAGLHIADVGFSNVLGVHRVPNNSVQATKVECSSNSAGLNNCQGTIPTTLYKLRMAYYTHYAIQTTPSRRLKELGRLTRPSEGVAQERKIKSLISKASAKRGFGHDGNSSWLMQHCAAHQVKLQ